MAHLALLRGASAARPRLSAEASSLLAARNLQDSHLRGAARRTTPERHRWGGAVRLPLQRQPLLLMLLHLEFWRRTCSPAEQRARRVPPEFQPLCLLQLRDPPAPAPALAAAAPTTAALSALPVRPSWSPVAPSPPQEPSPVPEPTLGTAHLRPRPPERRSKAPR